MTRCSNPKSQAQTTSHNSLTCPITQFKAQHTILHYPSTDTALEPLGKCKPSKNTRKPPSRMYPAKSTSLLRPKSCGSVPPNTRASSSNSRCDFLRLMEGHTIARLPSPSHPILTPAKQAITVHQSINLDTIPRAWEPRAGHGTGRTLTAAGEWHRKVARCLLLQR